MKSSPSRWLKRMSGCVASVLVFAACATNSIPTDPAVGEPFWASEERLDEYVELMNRGEAPSIRAWIREADRVIRANNAMHEEMTR